MNDEAPPSGQAPLPLPVEPPSFDLVVPPGDNRKRRVCRVCGEILYENPRIIVGAICVYENRILMVRRGIEPRLGYWTFPSGYMERNETTEQGAAREVLEESGARVRIGPLLALYSLPHISQVHMVYRADMLTDTHFAGEESLESALFDWSDLPWDHLAYPTTHWALRDYARTRDCENFAPAGRPDDENA